MSVLDDTSLLYRLQRGPPSYLPHRPLCVGRTALMNMSGHKEERMAESTAFKPRALRERGTEDAMERDMTTSAPETPSKYSTSSLLESTSFGVGPFVTVDGDSASKQAQHTAESSEEARPTSAVASTEEAQTLLPLRTHSAACTPKRTPELEEVRPVKVNPRGKLATDETPDPDDALLPQGTRVRIIGNNRTKPKWVGLEGTIESGAPIGGWHVICLDDGRRIRVQRNAIQAIDIPRGAIFVETTPGLKLKRERSRPKANRGQGELSPSSPTFSAVTPNAGIHRSPATKPLLGSPPALRSEAYFPGVGDQEYRTPPLNVQQSNQHSQANVEAYFDTQSVEKVVAPFPSSNQMDQSAQVLDPATSPEQYDSDVRELHHAITSAAGVTISRLNAKALRRYSKRFGLPLRSDVSRAQLVHEVQSHFSQMMVDESSAIRDFLRTLHEGGNTRDQQKMRPVVAPAKRPRIESKLGMNAGRS